MKLCLKSGRPTHFTPHLRFHLTITVKNRMQDSYTVQQRRRIISSEKRIEEQLSIPAIFKRKSVHGQKGSEELTNLFCSKLAEPQVVITQKLIFFQLSLPAQHYIFHLAHDVLRSKEGGFFNPHELVLHGFFRRGDCSFELGGSNRSMKRRHHDVVNAGRLMFAKEIVKKIEKGIHKRYRRNGR